MESYPSSRGTTGGTAQTVCQATPVPLSLSSSWTKARFSLVAQTANLRDHDLDLPIEGLSLNADGTVLASVSHESLIRLWDISDLGGGNASEEEDEGSEVDDSDKDDGSDGADATENGDEMESEEVQELSASDKKRRIHQDSDSEDEDGLPDPEPVQQVKKVEKRPTKKHVPTAQQKAYFGDLD
ncbi:hypothetical protein BC830DRAFT_1085810 [Chytriomyces sp. MP71]|nr:hypothetical protein BC830DRAFT_1085810 [Chytriomyces sp. MP71]